MALTTSVSDAVSFDQLRGFPELFTTYCQDYPRVSRYYAADFRSTDARRQVADIRARFPEARDRLAEVLLDQNQQWQMDSPTRENIERLRNPESVAVVTGQQIGLFTGPLYTVYKTITALLLSEKLAEDTGRPVVPVFWMASEDHDYDEIAEIHLINRNRAGTVRYEEHENLDGMPHGPVGRLTIGDEMASVVEALAAGILDTEFKEDLLARLRSTYAPGTRLADAFARLLNGLFPDSGLVLVSPDDRRLKRLAAPLWRREIEEYHTSESLVQQVSAELEEKSFHAQIGARATNLFLLESEGRFALEPLDDKEGFRLRGIDRQFSTEDLLQIVDEEPGRFSPNVAFRPLMQDLLFPTAAYIAGPSETSYFAQLKPLYEWMDIPMPVIYPRVSATIVESKVRKVLERYDLSVPHFQEDLGTLFKQVVIDHAAVDVESEYDDAVRFVHEAINQFKPVAEKVDETLVSSAEATRAALESEMAKLKDKIIRAQKRNHDEIKAQLKKARVGLFPGGELQERYLSPLYFLNKYSPAIIDDWQEHFSLDTTAHQIIDL